MNSQTGKSPLGKYISYIRVSQKKAVIIICVNKLVQNQIKVVNNS